MGSVADASDDDYFVTTIRVDTTLDSFDVPGECSLRSAVYAADKDVATGGCPAGEPYWTLEAFDKIVVPGGTYRLDRVGAGEDEGLTGDLDTSGSGPMFIDRATSDAKVTIDGVGSDRIFDVGNAAAPSSLYTLGYLGFRNLTLTHGWAEGLSDGDGGGAIRAIDARLGGSGLLLADNESNGHGGAIFEHDSDVSLQNSTITGNRAAGSGGGIYAGDTMPNPFFRDYLSSVTIAFNEADSDLDGSGDGGGVAATGGGTFAFANTILASNSNGSTNSLTDDCWITSPGSTAGYTLSTQELDSEKCPVELRRPVSTADPELLPLRDNGGPTRTLALRRGSPAIGVNKYFLTSGWNYACSLWDQRGKYRALGHCDLGAFQHNPVQIIQKFSLRTAGDSDGTSLYLRIKCPPRFGPECRLTMTPRMATSQAAIGPRETEVLASGETERYEFLIEPEFRRRVAKLTRTGGKVLLTVRVQAKRFAGKPLKHPVGMNRLLDVRRFVWDLDEERRESRAGSRRTRAAVVPLPDK